MSELKPDFKTCTSGELVRYCGDSGARWAEAFMNTGDASIAPDEGTMLGWFANAIETAHAKRMRTPDTSAKVDVAKEARNAANELRLASETRVMGNLYAPIMTEEEAHYVLHKLRRRGYVIVALQAPRSDTSAVELVREGLAIASTPAIDWTVRENFKTKAEQWLKNRGDV
jgi:hypothetical protein